jgi:hypothetical protein
MLEAQAMLLAALAQKLQFQYVNYLRDSQILVSAIH